MQLIKNLFNKRYRVLEVTDANNLTKFHPESKEDFFAFRWKRLTSGKSFETYAKANGWLCKRVYDDNRDIIVKTRTHKCDLVFDKLQSTENSNATTDDAAELTSSIGSIGVSV